MNAIATANEIISLFQTHGGNEYAGERVTQLEHMFQAAELAEQQGYDEEVILAAFLHDIGHICVSNAEAEQMEGFGTMDHEEVGAAFLKERGFSKKLVRLVESHVEAKRYLTWKNPAYYEQLSEASKRTLEFQGGRMETDEAQAFEQHPLFELIIQMRMWDEEAKVENLPVGNLDKIKMMMIRHLYNQSMK
jgi:2-amino-1-hydroxyethylphosphonate dioxygenase (glycine-forming)